MGLEALLARLESVDALLTAARADGIEVLLLPGGKLRIRGPAAAVKRWRPMLTPHEEALRAVLHGEAVELLVELTSAGMHFEARGDALLVWSIQAPEPTDEQRAAIRAHKPELLRLLRPQADPPAERVLREARAAGLAFEFNDLGIVEFSGPPKAVREFKPRIEEHYVGIAQALESQGIAARRAALQAIERIRGRGLSGLMNHA